MQNPVSKPVTVDDWLAYIEALHPKSIAMGLERVSVVAKRLALTPTFKIITVAGTNGKGSTCAMLTKIYADAGYQVGTYTSPHLISYHERVKVNNKPISDADLCAAFAAVEDARAEIELTYFEMGTLAAVWHFLQTKLDVVVLEVGLGGRLDAVNIFDADCAILTNVDLDHMEYLGDTRELIGAEKAGVYRQNQISICGDIDPPSTLVGYAKKIGANLKLAGVDFAVSYVDGAWLYRDAEVKLALPKFALVGDFQVQNAASVIYAVRALHQALPVNDNSILDSLASVQLLGRFQYLHHNPDIIVDVAHNPHAALSLKQNIEQVRHTGKVVAVFAMLADKDIARVVDILKGHIDVWHISQIQHPRAATVEHIKAILLEQGVSQPIYTYVKLEDALSSSCKNISKNDKIIAFGSFFTVASILEFWQVSKDRLNISG
jgi:dihydrofolate synthase / folylpolyglutamate synthase